jgi:hypothetical protein
MWERDESLGAEIASAWLAAGKKENLGEVADALKIVMKNLREWSLVKFGSVRKELESLRKRLADLQGSLMSEHVAAEIRETSRKLDEVLYREEMMWLQWSRVMWLNNTNFFHRKAIWRGRRNRIKKLWAPDGNWMEGEAELGNLIKIISEVCI